MTASADDRASHRTAAQVRILIWIGLLLIVSSAFLLRTGFQYDNVFVGGETFFQETDPWCHMRQVDALLHTFPRQNTFDVYGAYPGGASVPVAPFFDWILAAIILIIGWGTPSPALVDAVGAFFPAVLGALVPIAVYHVARRLFNRSAGFVAAALAAFAPGQLLVRSLLGYTDHHAMESLLSTLIMLSVCAFLLKDANKNSADGRPNDAYEPREGYGRPRLRWALSGTLTGIVLTMYLLSWVGGAMVVAILAAWISLQFVADYLMGRKPARLLFFGIPMFAIPLLAVSPYAGKVFGFPLQVRVLLLGLLAICALGALSWFAGRANVRRRWFLIATIGLCGAGILAIRLAAPAAFRSIIGQFGRFSGDDVTIYEMMPLLHGGGLSRIWTEFGPALYVAVIGLGIIAHRALRRGEAASLLVLIWTVAMTAATLGQVRFSYYLGVVVTILAGGVVGLLVMWLWRRAEMPRSAGKTEKAVRSFTRRRGQRKRASHDPPMPPSAANRSGKRAWAIGVGLAATLALLLPSANLAMTAADRSLVLHPDWREATQWLRENTPEPFGDPDLYYAYYGSPDACRPLLEARSAYGVLGWWDCGYWIMRLGHRIPVSNPTQHGAGITARFMTAQDEATASKIAKECGARYVILDVELPAWQPPGSRTMMGKFENLARWAGEDPTHFYERCYRRDAAGTLQPIILYYPEYYRTLISRLYVCRGQAYQPSEVHVVECHETRGAAGEPIKEIIFSRQFDSYAEAGAFVEQDKSKAYRIVGVSPYYPCIPLEDMHDYRLVHQSPEMLGRRSGQEVRYVEIYEFLGWGDSPEADR